MTEGMNEMIARVIHPVCCLALPAHRSQEKVRPGILSFTVQRPTYPLHCALQEHILTSAWVKNWNGRRCC